MVVVWVEDEIDEPLGKLVDSTDLVHLRNLGVRIRGDNPCIEFGELNRRSGDPWISQRFDRI